MSNQNIVDIRNYKGKEYKSKDEHILEKAQGIILINYGQARAMCNTIHNTTTGTGYVSYNIYADSIETAQNMYYELLPEIRQKEKLYKSVGMYDDTENISR